MSPLHYYLYSSASICLLFVFAPGFRNNVIIFLQSTSNRAKHSEQLHPCAEFAQSGVLDLILHIKATVFWTFTWKA